MLFIVRRLVAHDKVLSDFELTVWSAIVILVFVSVTGLTNIDLIRDNFFRPQYFGTLFTLAIGIGALIGYLFRLLRKGRALGDSWTIPMVHYMKHGSWVIVITKSGQEYYGKYNTGTLD
jgi:hypothetical protein